MMECSLTQHCIFFNSKMNVDEETRSRLIEKMCKDNYSSCARYMIYESLGSDKVPDNLRPDMKLEAVSIMEYSLDFLNRTMKYRKSIDRAVKMSMSSEMV